MKVVRIIGSALMSLGFNVVVLVVGAEFYRLGAITPEMIVGGIMIGFCMVIVGVITNLAADQPKQPNR